MERRLVQLGARSFLGTARDDEILEYLRQPCDGLRLAEVAAREGMAGIVAAELERVGRLHPFCEIPLEHLVKAVQPVFAHAGAHFSELLKVGDGLDDAGLRVVVLKGGALLHTVYQRRFAFRPLSDIDLLVDPAELSEVESVLRSRGFLALASSPSVFTRGRLAFDLHTEVTCSTRIRRRSLAFQPCARRLWEDARPMSGGRDSILVLSDVHHVLHSSVHSLKHSYSRLIWLVDLALLLPKVDWDEMMAEAESSGTTRAVSYACHILRRLLDVQLPSGWAESCPSLNTFERVFVDGVVKRSETLTAGELLVAFSIPSWRDRFAYIFELACPSRHVLSGLFPGTPRWLLLPRRCGQMLVRGFVKLFRILCSPGWQSDTKEALRAQISSRNGLGRLEPR